MGNKTTSIGMSKLLANASKMEKEIKETENVAPTITVEPEQPQQNSEEQLQEVKEVVEPEENVLSEKKGKDEQEDKEKNKSCNRKEEYNLLFQERMIRISKETHAKLKRLANVSDVSMHVLATNILEIAFEKYNKEIQAAVKKYMSL